MNRAVHFVRFATLDGQHYVNAVRIWGEPDFVHRQWDRRARREIMDGDTVVFGKGPHDQQFVEHDYDDSAYQ